MKINKTQRPNLIITIMVLITIYLMLLPNKVNAVLQSNGDSPATYDLGSWVTGIRQMQAAGGTLGLTDTINGSDLTSTNTNLDIHMEKNTEFGAMAILSASSYGNPDKINDGQTTTGNVTGVVMKINSEWVATSTTNNKISGLNTSKNRYKHLYPVQNGENISYSEKIGDAISIGNWHGSTQTRWMTSRSSAGFGMFYPNNVGYCDAYYIGLLRSTSGSIFSYDGYVGWAVQANGTLGPAYSNQRHPSRAVIVVGSGI